MEKQVIELYDERDIAQLTQRRHVWLVVAVAIAAVGLALCITFCFLARTGTVDRMLLSAIITSTVTGWIVISIVHFAIDENRNAQKHIVAMLEGPREVVEGPFTLTKERLRVRRGVSMVRIDGKQSLQVYDKKAALLANRSIARIYAVYGFAVAYEANDALD